MEIKPRKPRPLRVSTRCIILAMLSATAISALVEETRGDTIFTPAAGTQTLATIDTNSLAADTVGPFDVLPPDPPAAATLSISAAFGADGTTLYTLLNTLAETEENVSSQLAIIDQATGKITAVGQPHPLNVVAMEVDAGNTIWATGFNLNPNPAFPGLNWFGDSKLYQINKVTGALTEVGETNINDGPIMDLAIDAAGTVWATTRNRLWTLDTATGASTHITDISGVTEGRPEGAEIMGIFFDSDDTLLGTEIATGDLLTIDTTTGNATFAGATGLANPHGGDIFVPEPSTFLLVAVAFGVFGHAWRLGKRIA